MAGLYTKELLLRAYVARCLVVAPGGLVAQWQDELSEKFSLDFAILTRAAIGASHTGNPLAERDLVIARLDHAAELMRRLGGLSESERDLAYRLYAICERRGRAEAAFGSNAPVTSWPEILHRAGSPGLVQPELAP